MKKNYYLPLIAGLLLGIASCSLNQLETVDDAMDQPGRKITFIATSDSDLETKTVRQSDGSVFWKPGEFISVFYGNTTKAGGDKFQNNNGKTTDDAVAVFDGTITSTNPPSQKYYYGLYPYDETATYQNNVITTSLPDIQTATPGTFADNLFITVGRSSGTDANSAVKNMAFFNICGGFKFTLNTDDVIEVVISAKEDIAGKIDIKMSDSVTPTFEVKEGKKSISLKTANGSAFEKGKTYYFVTLPTSLTASDLTIKMYKAASYGKFTGSSITAAEGLSFKRSRFASMSNIDAKAQWESAIYIPDPYFKAFLVNQSPLRSSLFDTNNDGEISLAEAQATNAKKLFIDDMECDYNDNNHLIKDLTGIEFFTKLENVYIQSNNLEKGLDITNATNLNTFTLMSTKYAQAIDISGKTNLESASIWHCPIPSLKIDNCGALMYAGLRGAKIAGNITFSNLPKLHSLMFSGVALSLIDHIYYTYNNLTITNCSNSDSDAKYEVDWANITNYTLTNCKADFGLNTQMYNPSEEEGDGSYFENVTITNCNSNIEINAYPRVKNLTINGGTGDLDIDSPTLTTLTLGSNNHQLTSTGSITIKRTQLTQLNLSKFTTNKVKNLEIKGNSKLASITYPANSLMDILDTFDISDNKLSGTFNPQGWFKANTDPIVNLFGNQFTTINIRNTNLNGTLTKIDMSPMNNVSNSNTLTSLYVNTNQLQIEGITKNRSTDRIPQGTVIYSPSGTSEGTIDEPWQ